MTKPNSRRATRVGALVLVALVASCAGDGTSPPLPTAPTVAAERVEPSSPPPGDPDRPHPSSAAPAHAATPNSPFWDEEIKMTLVKRKAHIAYIKALVQSHGMPEEDIQRLMAVKQRHLEEEIAWLNRMKARYPM